MREGVKRDEEKVWGEWENVGKCRMWEDCWV